MGTDSPLVEARSQSPVDLERRLSVSTLDIRGTSEGGEQLQETPILRMTRSKIYALIAVCLMSVGSHLYATPPSESCHAWLLM